MAKHRLRHGTMRYNLLLYMSVQTNSKENCLNLLCTFTCLHRLHLSRITDLYNEIYNARPIDHSAGFAVTYDKDVGRKRSDEVWQLLSAVKTEFGNFSGLLQKAQNNMQTGLNQLEDVVGKRTRAIEKKLKDVHVLNVEETNGILPIINSETVADEEE